MKTSKLNKIKIQKSGFKRSKFNWSHDVNTTFGWGEIQPTQCRMLVPGSKTTLKTQSLLRMAPMVAPTFGRVKYKTFNQFVGLEEIFPNFGPLMSQEPVQRNNGKKVPKFIPFIRLGLLSSWVLQGCHGTLYKIDTDNKGIKHYQTYYRGSPNANTHINWSTGIYEPIKKLFGTADDPWNSQGTGFLPNVGNKVCLVLQNFDNAGEKNYKLGLGFDKDSQNTDYTIVTGMSNINEMCPVMRDFTDSRGVTIIPDTCKEVTIEGADYVLEGNYKDPAVADSTPFKFALAVELSDFGKRLRKIIQGCGYQIDFTSTANVSILPILATYKAYFDVFGLQLYQGWETTKANYVINHITENFDEDMSAYFRRTEKNRLTGTIANMLAFFINELSNMWYTDNVDFVSAHQDCLSIGPAANLEQKFITVNGNDIGDSGVPDTEPWGIHITNSPNIRNATRHINTNAVVGDNIDSSQLPSEASEESIKIDNDSLGSMNFIDRIGHSQVDSELLKRLYKWTNRNSILGRKIADLLRAQGLGKYVDECKSNYIGSSDTYVTISDVVSTAWTDKATLGEFGGKGLQYSEEQTLVFENDEFGYWICLATVVPEAGYTQGIDPTLKSLDKMSFYNPDFDAIGMEATQKDAIVGTNYVTGPKSYITGYTFGFVPRMSGWKMQHNLVNGDFNRRALRNTYMPYTLDKQIDINDTVVKREDYDAANAKCDIEVTDTARRIPHAGNVWRYPTKHNWLGNFNRIFADVGVRDDNEGVNDNINANDEGYVIGWSDYTNDNFLSHAIYDLISYAPMKPINDSYGLDDEEPNQAGSEFVSKA